jgi:hypothetical protein
MKTIRENHIGFVQEVRDLKLTNPNDVKTLNDWIQEIQKTINGGLRLGDGTNGTRAGNFSGQLIEFVSPAVANTEMEFLHGLGRVPIGWVVLYQDLAGSLYASIPESWSNKLLYLKSSVASCTYRIWVN